MIVRFRYTKLGNAAYIGHLEMTKLFERGFRRSGVVVRYTEGFNPSVKLNFASPLSVGIESEYEVAEVEIEDGSFDRFSGILLPLGIRILEYKQVEKGLPLMSRLAYSSYLIKIVLPEIFAEESVHSEDSVRSEDSVPAESSSSDGVSANCSGTYVSECISRFSEQPEIMFEKRTKKGSKTVNMKEFVKEIRLEEGGDACTVKLVSGNNGSLNPGALCSVLFPDCKVKIRRVYLTDTEGMELY